MLEKLKPHLLTWAQIHGAERNQPYPWNSFLIQAQAGQVQALVDPLPLKTDEIQQVEAFGPPTHILLTCNYHERNSALFRQRWGCKILLHENQVPQAEIDIDATFKDRDLLWDLVEVVRVANVRYPEEVCFLLKQDGGALIIGDLVSGGRKDRGIPDGEVGINAPEYMVDLNKGRAALETLLQLQFDLACFGHGTAIRRGAKAVLQRFIENDSIWEGLKRERTQRLKTS